MDEKKAAGTEAGKLVKDGSLVGLGTGSTVKHAIVELGRRVREEGLKVRGVPTSEDTAILAVEKGIPLTSFMEVERLDIALDGADQVSESHELIKGGGAALFREKVVASNSREFVVVVDEGKLAQRLDIPVPVEVLPFAWPPVKRKLLKECTRVELREGEGKAGPVITDNGNYILDAYFGEIVSPQELEGKINSIVGVLENGIFASLPCKIIVGRGDKTEVLEWKR